MIAILVLGVFSKPSSAHETAPPGQSIVRDVVPIQVGDPIPQTMFMDQDGKPFRFSKLRGKTVLVSFIYTRCPDPRECPLISANFHGVQKRIGAGPFALVEVTLDPKEDTPARLRAYGRQFEANPADWTFLTGAEASIFDFAAKFDVSRFDDPTRGVIHNDRTVLIDPHGRIDTFIDETGWSPDGVYAQMRNQRRVIQSRSEAGPASIERLCRIVWQ